MNDFLNIILNIIQDLAWILFVLFVVFVLLSFFFLLVL